MDARPTYREKAERLAAEFATRASAHDRDGSFPFENFKQLSHAGLLSLMIPRASGGAGAGLREAAAILGSIGKACPATALVLVMHYQQHAAIARNERWPTEIVRRLQRESVDGVSLINALRVEPELGSPARGGMPAALARHDGQGWSLSGCKIYSTGAPILKWYAVWARTEGSEPLVGMFLVEASTPGITIMETWDHIGLRASGSHDVRFENVRIPETHAVDLRRPAEWLAPDAHYMCGNAVLISALYDGVARAARDWIVSFLKERSPSNLGAPLASLPRMQEAVGAIEALLSANARLIASLASEADMNGPPPSGDSALVKLTVTENAIKAVEDAMKLAGNPGLSRRNPLERHYRDVLCARVHTPQADSIRVVAGRAALGY